MIVLSRGRSEVAVAEVAVAEVVVDNLLTIFGKRPRHLRHFRIGKSASHFLLQGRIVI